MDYDNVGLPPVRGYSSHAKIKEDIAGMEIGQSFETEHTRVAIYNAAACLGNVKIATRKQDNGKLRVFRIS